MNLKPRVLLIGNIKKESNSMDKYFEFVKSILPKNKVDSFSLSKKYISKKIIKQIIYPFIIPRRCDIYHILDHSYAHLINFLPKRKVVITCHDLIPLRFPEKMSFRGRILFNYYTKKLEKAKFLIAVSLNTKKDIINLLKIPEKKIEVIYPVAISKKNFSISKESIKIKEGLSNKIILLSVGNFFYKNTILILKSLNLLKRRYKDILLIKIGGFSDEEKYFIKKNKLDKMILVKKNLSEKEMNKFYYISDMLVFPSIYEGFGIPPLEAMACGTPVITSNKASLPEIVGDAAIKINPYSVNELKKAIIKIIEDKKFRENLIRGGYQNLKKFDKKIIKRKLIGLYNKIYEENERCAG